MTLIVATIFTPRAEILVQGQTGLHAIDYQGIYPMPGDLVSVRTSPGNQLVEARCLRRALTIELDLP